MPTKAKNRRSPQDRAASIYRRLRGARGLDDDELWQHALFFAMSPDERCRLSLKTARSALSLKRSAKKASGRLEVGRDKDITVLPIPERTLRLAKRLSRGKRSKSATKSRKK